MFEDIGHSSEARSKLKEYLIGSLKVLYGWMVLKLSIYSLYNLSFK